MRAPTRMFDASKSNLQDFAHMEYTIVHRVHYGTQSGLRNFTLNTNLSYISNCFQRVLFFQPTPHKNEGTPQCLPCHTVAVLLNSTGNVLLVLGRLTLVHRSLRTLLRQSCALEAIPVQRT